VLLLQPFSNEKYEGGTTNTTLARKRHGENGDKGRRDCHEKENSPSQTHYQAYRALAISAQAFP
jgi:hypothetical protein